MHPPEVEIDGVHYDTIDINIVPDLYVTWIVDIWKGDRHDPAVSITRYIGVWRADALENDGHGQDPDFSSFDPDNYYGKRANRIKPEPLHWKDLETIREADRDAEMHKSQDIAFRNTDGYRSSEMSTRKNLYQQFMDAIEVVHDSPESEEAWAAIDRWREYCAEQGERNI